jgi:ABC-type transporter Mla subunit MlaD
MTAVGRRSISTGPLEAAMVTGKTPGDVVVVIGIVMVGTMVVVGWLSPAPAEQAAKTRVRAKSPRVLLLNKTSSLIGG